MNISFRPIEEKDNQPLAELVGVVFREFRVDHFPGSVYKDPTTYNLHALFQDPLSAYWVAENNGSVIGGCGVYPTDGLPDGCAELVKFYLYQEWRGRGIGRELMYKCFDSARSLGYRQLYLESFPEMGKAVGMYEKAGFRHLPHALGNSGHYSCTIWMLKDL